MNTRKILLNGLLAMGLAGAGGAYAADTDETAARVQERETIRAQNRVDTAAMSAEEAEQYRIQQREQNRTANQAAMTDEERAAMRAEKQAGMTDEERAAMWAEKQESKSGQKQGGSDKGKGSKLRDGSGAGSQQRGSGRGAGGGMSMR